MEASHVFVSNGKVEHLEQKRGTGGSGSSGSPFSSEILLPAPLKPRHSHASFTCLVCAQQTCKQRQSASLEFCAVIGD